MSKLLKILVFSALALFLGVGNVQGGEELVDAWANVKYVSDATRRNVTFLEKLDFLKGVNGKGLRDHIFIGDYRNVTGCHFYSAVDNVNVRFVDGVTPEANSLGVIKGDIEMRKPLLNPQGDVTGYKWVKKNTQGEPQTFFPSNWSQDEILEQCSSALSNSNKQLVPGYSRMWEAESDAGVFIRWFEDANGNVTSIFPEF